MLGLSITALKGQTFQEAVASYQHLRTLMGLNYIELAVAIYCDIRNVHQFGSPLVLHDHCLYDGYLRLRLDRPKHIKVYREIIEKYPVLAVHIHAPRRSEFGNLNEVRTYLSSIQKELAAPLYVENMPNPKYYCSNLEECHDLDFPMVVDTSHVNLWASGDNRYCQDLVFRLLEKVEVKALHLSHNKGDRDSHLPIPPNLWINDYIWQWQEMYMTTYESLPKVFN